MKLNLVLTPLAVLAVFCTSCLKRDIANSPLSAGKLSAAAKDDTTGFTGAQACYNDYFNTLSSPPDDYVPGDAEIDLNTCLAGYVPSSGDNSSLTLLPPAPPAVLTLYPVDSYGTVGLNNVRYLNYFHLTSFYGPTPADFTAANATFQRYSGIVCDAVTENITYANPSNIDKITASVTYATNHPDRFLSDADKLEFLQLFLPLVFEQPTFVIAVGRGAQYTGLDVLASASSCVNLTTVIKL